jgi:hypothetical protein
MALQEAEHDDDAANDTLARAISAANQAATKPPDHVFATIAVTEAMLGNVNAAEEMVRRLPPDSRWWAWENMTSMLVNSGNLDAALQLAADEKSAYPKACALLGAADQILRQIRRQAESNTESK